MDLDLPLAATAPAAAMTSAFTATARTAPAQLIEYARGHYAALAPHAAIELLDQPRTVEVPGSAYYCQRLLQWRAAWLPLLDLRVLLAAYREHDVPPSRYALIVAWQPGARAPLSYGALSLPFLPQVVQVSDVDQCELPGGSDLWPALSLSCFGHVGRRVPVLDVAALFRTFQG